MISQSSIDNPELDKKYLDSLITLFKSRNNLKYPVDSPENKIIETLPIFDRNQINNFSNRIKTRNDVKDALINIGFQNNYKYNSVLLKEIIKYPPDIAIIVMYFQVLACVYFQKELTTEDFAFLIQVLNKLITKSNKDFINLSFYILFLKAQSSHTVWSKNCIQQVLLFFENNDSLTPQYYNILVHYLSLHVQPNEEDEQTIKILEMLKYIFKSNYPIVQVSDLSKIVELIHPLLFSFNYHSLLVFAYMSKIDKKSTESDIRIFPEFFTTLALKNADAQNMSIKVTEQKRIHDLPAVYSGHTPEMEYKIQNIDTFHNTFYPIPNELYKKNNQLSNLIPDNTKIIIRNVLKEFFEILDPKLIKIFFQEMNKALLNCIKPNDYNGFAAYLYLLHNSIISNTKATALSKQYLDENIPYFFPKPKLSNNSTKTDNEISFGEMFYNPENTIFGPFALDPVINTFRTAILFLTTSTNLYKFIESMKGCPFLMAEQISRLCLRFDAEIFSSFNKSSERIFRTVSREMVVLQMQNAQVAPRNAFFLFFIHFLTNEKKVGDCFKSQIFVDSIFRYIFETGVMDQLILVITKGFLLMTNDTYRNVNIEPAIYFLYTAASRNSEIAPKIYRMVANVLKFRPFFINKFDRFLDLMINELQEKQTKESFDNALILIELMAGYYNKDDNTFKSYEFFKPKYFRIIATHVKYASYQKLFNLMTGGYNLDTTGVFLIRQPIFIPLLIIAYANDYKIINSIIELFYMLATKSETNCQALHDGDLDMILLKHLNKENPLKYKGVVIPQLKIDEKIANTTVLRLLKLIITSKSSFAIAKKMMEIIIKGQNIPISQLTNSILANSESLPSPAYPIGSLNYFCSVTGLTDKAFKGDISFTFWMKTDLIPLSHTTAIVNLISIIDKNDFSFNIVLQNNLLLASFETRKKKTSVCVCQRLNPNVWTHFAITFSNTPTQKPLISTFKNFERLHDSEFCYVEFAPGPLEVRFGGSFYNDRDRIYSNMQYGSISRILIFNRYISTNEIIQVMQDQLKMPNDYIISTIPNRDTSAEKKLSYNYIMNHYAIETLKNCFSNEQIFDRFIESFRTINSRPLIDEILAILDKIISSTKNKTISSRLAAILLNSDFPDYRLYKTLEQIISKISDKDTQKCWIEDILINIPIWSRSKTFDAVLYDYSKLIINYPHFFKKNLFYYFLNQFNIFVNIDKEKRDEKALKEFITFIERYPIAREMNEINIEKGAVNNLICYATNASDDDKVIFLEIIEKIADSINQVGYNEYEYIFHFVSMNNIDIALHAILALHQLLIKSFHAIVYSIIESLTISLNELFARLEPYVRRYQNLFSLTCAIGLKIGKSPSQFPFNITLSHCWFVFPLLSAMSVADNTPYIDLIARNAVKSSDINMIVVMTTYLNLFVEQNHTKNNTNILQSLLLSLFRNHKAESNLDRKYQIFFHLFSASFFKINAPLMREEIADMIQPKPESPEQIQKIKVIDFDSFKQMVTNAEVFINEIEKRKNELIIKYNEMKKKRDILAAQAAESQQQASQTDFKQDDEEFTHLESMIESVKSYKLRFNYSDDDLNTLRAAFTLFNRHLTNYTIEGIQSESSGTFFKTKIPAFGPEDIKQLMENFIQMYIGTAKSNGSNDDSARRLSLDSTSSNQLSSTFKLLDKEAAEEDNLKLAKEDNLNNNNNNLGSISNTKPSLQQITPSSSSPLSSSSQSSQLLPSSSSPSIAMSPLASTATNQNDQVSGNLVLHPISPYDKQLKIFDFFAECLNNYLNCNNFKKILSTIRPQKEFLKKIGPINKETCSNLIKSEEERARLQKVLVERSVKFVRSNVIGYSITPYLMKREKAKQHTYRFNPKMSALTSPNAKLICFNEKRDIYFEVPFSAELNEQLQKQQQQQQLQLQQQQMQQNLLEKQKQQQQQQQQPQQQNLSDKQKQQQNSPDRLKQQQQQQQNMLDKLKQQPESGTKNMHSASERLRQQNQLSQQKRPISQQPKFSSLIRLSVGPSSNPSVFNNDREYIIKTKDSNIRIDKSKVISIFQIDSTTIELFDNQNQPYLIKFNNKEETVRTVSKIKIDKRCKFPLNDDSNRSIYNSKSDNWHRGYVSTFHYLSILNFFSGRSYEDASRYPVFPSLTPFNKINDKSMPSLNKTFFPTKKSKGKEQQQQKEEEQEIQFDKRMFVLPELYYLFESDDFENVYKRRKLLEEVSKTDKQGKDSCLLKWIDQVFSTEQFSTPPLFNFSHIPRLTNKIKIECHQTFLDISTDSKIIYATPFYRESSFCMVLSTGEFRFFSLQITERKNQQQQQQQSGGGHEFFKGKRKKIENVATEIDIEIKNISTNAKIKYQLDQDEISSLKFAPLNVGYVPDVTALLNRFIKFGFVAYNNNRIHFVDLNGIVTKENIFLENPIFHNAVVLSTSSTISSISSFLGIQINRVYNNDIKKENEIDENIEDDKSGFVLYKNHANITCLHSSVNFGIIAIGSDDCKIRIRSLNDGKKIATVDLDESEVPTSILITESWGFVVVFCVSNLYVLSVNGKVIKKFENFPSFNQWFTFKSADDFDYIALFDDNECTMKYFEVVYPDKMKEVIFDGKIMTMRYEPKFNCFIFLSDNGKITLMPAEI